MTKERLEECIKQRATVWIDNFGEYKLDEKHCEICKINDLRGNFLGRYCFWYEYDYNGEKCHNECEFEDIEENVERGKWHWEMNACRTERFEPPMWEEIEKKYSFYFYIKDTSYNFHVNKDLRRIEFSRDFIGTIFLFRSKEFTKENYEKACEIVRDLFKGGKNDRMWSL